MAKATLNTMLIGNAMLSADENGLVLRQLGSPTRHEARGTSSRRLCPEALLRFSGESTETAWRDYDSMSAPGGGRPCGAVRRFPVMLHRGPGRETGEAAAPASPAYWGPKSTPVVVPVPGVAGQHRSGRGPLGGFPDTAPDRRLHNPACQKWTRPDRVSRARRTLGEQHGAHCASLNLALTRSSGRAGAAGRADTEVDPR